MEKNIRYFSYKNAIQILIKQVQKHYTKDSRYYKEVRGLSARKKFEPLCKQDAVITCDQSNVNFLVTWDCTTQHDHVWKSSDGDIYGPRCIAPGAQMEFVQISFHPCNGKAINDTIIIPYNLEYVDALEYKNISNWIYLDKTTETLYDENGQNPLTSEVQYYYEDPTHVQIGRKVSLTSTGKTHETKFKYPFDYDGSSNSSIAALINKNIIDVPIRTETTIDGNLVDGVVSLYNSTGQLEDIYKYESDKYLTPPTHNPLLVIPGSPYKLKSTIKFDPLTRNINEVKLKDNIGSIYLWGYGDTLPIAEIKNADNESLVNYATTQSLSITISGSIPEASIGVPFEIFSTQYISPVWTVNAQGSGYPSSPLVVVQLRKSDGTVINSLNTSWGQNANSNFSLSPGIYQWFYYLGDIQYNSNFTGINLSLTSNYTTRVTASRAFHTSFEEDGQDNSNSKTGAKVWSGTYEVNIPALIGTYQLSYWKKIGTNPWNFVHQTVVVSSNAGQSITIGESGTIIDEVRLLPLESQMTTYTYSPLIGVTSITDVNNQTTYFDYDDFGRLSLVRDKDRKILKKYEYRYKTNPGGQQ